MYGTCWVVACLNCSEETVNQLQKKAVLKNVRAERKECPFHIAIMMRSGNDRAVG
jgi:hypothetical protein